MTEQSVILKGKLLSRTEKSQKKEKKRKKIIKAALKIFSKKGYSPAAIDEVAHEAGIAKGTIYLYFKDKEDLFYSTIMSVIDDLASILREQLTEDMSPLEILENLARTQLRYFSKNIDFFNMYLTIINYNLLSNYTRLFRSIMERVEELFQFETELIERGKKEGFIRNDMETEDIVIAYHGTIYQIIDRMTFNKAVKTFDAGKKSKAVMKLFLEGAGIRK